jgi:hypothetical protein
MEPQIDPQMDPMAPTPTDDVKQEEYQPGPLLTRNYQSYDHLKRDLMVLGPNDAYNMVFDAVSKEDQDSAKGALTAFFRGYPEGLSSLYTLLVKAGKADPIDEKLVEDIMSEHPELSSKKARTGLKGLWLPPADTSIRTRIEKQASGGVGGPNPAYYTHGPKENRYCPKLRNVTSTFVCRYHCLDGLAIDDNQILCGEAIWRQAVMDKYSREYKDKDGNWVGGYINKRFEVERDTGGHPYQLKPGQKRAPIHEDAWSTEKRLQEMRRDEASKRGYSATTGDPKGLYTWDPYDQHGTTKNPHLSEKPRDKIAKNANAWIPNIKTAETKTDVVENDSMWDDVVQQQNDAWIQCTVTADTHMTSSWKLAAPSPIDVPNGSGFPATKCTKCDKIGAPGDKICSICQGKMQSISEIELGAIQKRLPTEPESGIPRMAARFSHGVYRYISSDGITGYGDTMKEAAENADLSKLEPPTLEEEENDVSYLMQSGDELPVSTKGVHPMAVAPQIGQMPVTKTVQDGVSELEGEQHISGDSLDLAYAEGLLDNDAEGEEQALVLGPDPKTTQL